MDAQTTQNTMRQMLKIIRTAELDPEAGRIARQVKALAYILPSFPLLMLSPGPNNYKYRTIQTLRPMCS